VGCGTEEVVHGLDERQANEVVVALDEAGLRAGKRREDGDGGWAVAVPAGAAGQAQRVLSERELPRQRPPGFGEVFGKGSMVPTAVEERALYLHALAGELARSVEAIDGVVEARVHLALPPADPLRAAPAPPPRAAVLVKCRRAGRAALDPLAPGIQALVAGAVEGLDPAAVSVVMAEAQPSTPPPPRAPGVPLRTVVLGSLAAAAAALALVLALAGAGGSARAWCARLRARSAA
jgi:type III secretion protein J